MPIYKKKNGTFYVSFYYKDYSGKTLRKKKEGFKKRKDAQQYMETFLFVPVNMKCKKKIKVNANF